MALLPASDVIGLDYSKDGSPYCPVCPANTDTLTLDYSKDGSPWTGLALSGGEPEPPTVYNAFWFGG